MKKTDNTNVNDTKAKKLIRKTGVILTLSAFCLAGNITSQQTGSTQIVQAAVTSIGNVVPSCKVTSRTATTVKLSIKKVTGASYYNIYRSTSKEGSYAYVGSTADSTYKDTGLKSKGTYYYKIQAVNASSKSKMSSVVTVYAAPAKVSNVKVSAASSTLRLSWTSISGAKEYRVYRASSKDGSYTRIGTTAAASYTDSSVKSGTTYYYKVRVCKTKAQANYYGAYSTVVSGKLKTESMSQSQNSYREEVLRLVNVERKKEGLSELSTTTSLQKAADQRAIETKTLFSHDRPNGSSCFTVLEEFGVSYRAAGENIAYGQRTPAEVVNAWMNSEGHRANIMSTKFGKIGIGYYESNGTIYWTQLFTN